MENEKEMALWLQSHGRMRLFDGASSEEIAAFEQENNVILPKGLKRWLVVSDGGEYYLPGGFQLYGIKHKPIIDVNEADRPNENYVVIGALATGDPVLCERGGESISIYNHETGNIASDEVYSDFASFLLDLRTLLGIGV